MKIFVTNLLLSIFLIIPLFAQDDELRQLRSEHFIINYDPDVGSSYVYDIKNIAEKYYRIITQEFNLIRDELWLWDNRAQIYIAEDREDYLESFKCSPWSVACVNYDKKLIYTYPNQKRFKQIFIHELTHIIFREYTGRVKLPLWIDEGIATYVENKYGGGDYKKRLRFLKKKMEKDESIPLGQLNRITTSQLNSASEEFVNLFYFQSFSLVDFIIKKYGKYKFSNFISYIEKGYSLEDALAKEYYYLQTLENLEKQWKRYY